MADNFDFFAEDEQPESPTIADYGKAFFSGLGQLSSSAQGALGVVAEKLGEKDVAKRIRRREEGARAQTELTVDSMSPVAKQRLQSNVLSGDFWEHPLSASALKLTQMAPSTIAAGAVGGVGGAALKLGPIGSTALAGATNAGLATGEYIDDVRSQVAELDDAKLKEASPYYAGLRTLMSEDDARAQFENKLIDGSGRLPINLVVGFLGGAVGVEGMLARGAKGAMSGGIGRRALLGGLEGAAGEIPEESVGDVTAQQAAVEGGLQKEIKLDQTLAVALEAGLLGVPGAGLGALHKAPPPTPRNMGRDLFDRSLPATMSPDLFKERQAANVPPVPSSAPSTGATPKTTRATTQPPPNVTAQAGVIGNTVNPPTRDQEPGTVKEAAAGATVKETSKRRGRMKAGVRDEAPVADVLGPDVAQQAALSESLPPVTSETPAASAPVDIAPTSVSPASVSTTPKPYKPIDEALGAFLPEAQRTAAPVTPEVSQSVAAEPVVPQAPTPESAAPQRDLYSDAVSFVRDSGKASTSAIQRQFGIGYANAVKLVQRMEKEGVITIPDAKGKRLVADPKLAEPKIVVEPDGKETRILRDVSPEGLRKNAAAVQESGARAARNLKDAEKEAAEPQAGHRGPKELKARQENNAKGDAIAERFPSSDEELAFWTDADARTTVQERARAMVQAAEAEGVEIPNSSRTNIAGDRGHSAGVRLLMEAKKLAAAKRPKDEHVAEFLTREKLLRAGRIEEVDAMRREVGDEHARVTQGDVEASEVADDLKDEFDPHAALERKQSDEHDTSTAINEDFEEQLKNAPEQQKTVTVGKLTPKAKEVLEKVQRLAEKGSTEGERAAAAKAAERITANAKRVDLYKAYGDAPAPKVEKRGRIKVELSPEDRARATAALRATKKESRTPFFNPKEFVARRNAELAKKKSATATGERPGYVLLDRKYIPIVQSDRVGDMLNRLVAPQGKLASTVFEEMRRRVEYFIRDMDVHWVGALPPVDTEYGPQVPLGLYKPRSGSKGGYVVLSTEILTEPQDVREHVIFHETLHGATEEALQHNPELRARVTRIMDEVEALFPDHSAEYGFENESEFIAEAFSNPEFQELLARTRISDSLARDLNMPKASLLDAFIDTIRRLLRLDPGAHTALEALLRQTNEAMWESADIKKQGAAGANRAAPFIKREDVTRGVTDRAINWRGHGRKLKRYFASNTMLARMAEGLGHSFGELARKANDLHQRMAVKIDNILRKSGGVHDLTLEGDKLRRENPKAMDQAFELAHKISEFDLDMSDGAKNEHIFGRSANSDILSATQAKAAYGDLKRQLDDLKREAPDVAAWLEKVATYYRDDDNAKRLAVIKRVLAEAEVDEPGLAERILNDGVTKADADKFKTNIIVKHLNEIAELKRKRGWYVPFMREGDFVVEARRKIPDPTAAHTTRIGNTNEVLVVDPSGNRRFAPSRRAAKAYLNELYRAGFHAKAEKVFVLKSNGKTIVPSVEAEAIGAPETFKAYKVVINNQFMALHKDEASSSRQAEQLRALDYENVSETVARKNPNAKFGGLVPSQVEILINSLQKRDKFKGLSEAQQSELIQSLRQSVIKLLPGARIQHHNLERRNVEGYQKDMIHSLARYGRQSAAFQARTELQPEIDRTLQEMQEEIDANKDSKLTKQRQELKRDLESRLSIGQDFEPTGVIDKTVGFVSKLSMIDKLAGPSFHLINAQEPWTTAAPVIGGRHGFGSAIGALKGAYNMIGARGALAAGFRDTRRAFSQDEGFTDYRNEFKRQIVRNISGDRGRRINEMLDHLHDLNLFGHEAGMEVQRLAQPPETLAGRAVDRIDLMSRQVGQAIEAINRAATGIAAYELEFKRNGGNHQAAMRYAHDIVHDTMGNYSASNSAPVFNTTLGKSALQFKKFAVRTYFLLGSMAGKAIRGDREAMRAFAGVMFTHAVVAGALGLPLEPIKVALMVSGALGGFSYDDFEALVRDTAAQAVGKTGGELVTRGVPRALLGYDAASRQGLDSLLTFGKPSSNKPNDIKSWLFDTVAGAPAGMPIKAYAGVQAALEGDVERAIDNLVPVKAVRDVARAGFGMTGGKKDRNGRQILEPYSPFEAAVQGLGFTPSRKAETYEEMRRVNDQSFERKSDRTRLINAWVNASPAEKRDAWRAVQKFNRTMPHDAQITMSHLQSQAKSRRAEKAEGRYDRGMRVSKQNRDLYVRAERTYSGE